MMKTVKAIFRQRIKKPDGGIHDDLGLKALGGYFESFFKVASIEDVNKCINNYIEDNKLGSLWEATYEVVKAEY